jgi:hypothetical protein
MMADTGLPRALRGYALAGALILSGAPAQAAEFPAVVEEILASQTTGRIAEMGAAQKSAMIACVIRALAPLPAGRKRYVAEGASLGEREDRFGEVVNADHARWKKKIADACAKIALGPAARDNESTGEN